MPNQEGDLLKEIENIKADFNEKLADLRYKRDRQIQKVIEDYQIKKIRNEIK